MTDKELKKLNRSELLGLLLEESKENEQLRMQLKETQDALADRRIEIEKAGSIAEASLQLNGVFLAAQAACEQYIENIEHLSSKQEKLCEEKVRETKEKCRLQEQQTEKKCQQMIEEAQQKSKAYWDEVSQKIQDFTNSCSDLQFVLNKHIDISEQE